MRIVMNNKTKAIIAYLIVMLAGFAAGYAFHSYQATTTSYNQWDQSEEKGSWDHERRGMGQEMGIGRRVNERLSRELSLQQDQKDPFFRRIWQFRRGVRDEIRDRRENERELIRERYYAFRNDVSEILTEEQLIKLDQFAHPDSVANRGNERRFRR